ncbi:MAG: Uma2 family endonuclease [Dehalococcoidia bacterium]|nr:Uma2 family endonuclease [Dehalococcoidia bacterium]
MLKLDGGDPNALVAGSAAVFIVYDSVKPGSVVAPDSLVIFGAPDRYIKRTRRLYRIDEWGQTPAFVMEVATDLDEKRELYARMGAREYWRFDPLGEERYGEPLACEWLMDSESERFESRVAENGDVWARSEVLGLDFCYRIGENGYGTYRFGKARRVSGYGVYVRSRKRGWRLRGNQRACGGLAGGDT